MQHPGPPGSLFAPLTLRSVSDDDDSAPLEKAEESLPDPKPDARLPVMPQTYVCPGEKHAIPRSIHLARLAAFYPNCRNCEHRTDTGQMPRSLRGRLELTARRGEQMSLFRTDGIRGVYLNQLTRTTAARIAAALADLLWELRPREGRSATIATGTAPASPSRVARPVVVIGLDARECSPDLCVGVSRSLVLMGCDVVDIGRVSRPCFLFAVEHLQADAGIYVTGAGCPDSWTGLDLVGKSGLPWSMNGTLADIERRFLATVARSTRLGGSQRFFDAAVPYRANLLKHFQQLRPLRVVCLFEEPAACDLLAPLLRELPGELECADPNRCRSSREGKQGTDSAVMEMTLRESSADWGVLIGEDGGSLRLYDRQGRCLPSAEVLNWLLNHSAALSQERTAVIEAGVDDSSRTLLTQRGYRLVEVGEGSEAVALRMHSESAALAVQSGGRIWSCDTFPRCDAAVTLGRLLQSLSGSG